MYAVGETVKVRNDLVPEKHYQGVRFAPEMKEYYGVITKITKTDKFHGAPMYHLEGCSSWWFSDEMLEFVSCLTPTPAKFKVGDKIMVVEKATTTDKLIGFDYPFSRTLVGCTGEITYDNNRGIFTCYLKKSNGNSVGTWVIHQDNLVLLSDNSTQPVTSQSESKTTTLKPFEPAKTSTISITEVEVECCKKETYTI